MAKDKTGKDIGAEANDGDYSDPSKSAKVDWSYDPGYLRRPKTCVGETAERLCRKRRKPR